jgi:hypothetical protein
MRIFTGIVLALLVIVLSTIISMHIKASPFLRETFDPYETGDSIHIKRERSLYLYTDINDVHKDVEMNRDSLVSIASFKGQDVLGEDFKKDYSIFTKDVRTNEVYFVHQIESKDYTYEGSYPIGEITLPEGTYYVLIEEENEEGTYTNFQIGTKWRANLGNDVLNVFGFGLRIGTIGILYFVYRKFFTIKTNKLNQ